VIASSALVLGALAGGRFTFPKRVVAAMLSFAAGALITALTFEMFDDSYEQGGIWRAALRLVLLLMPSSPHSPTPSCQRRPSTAVRPSRSVLRQVSCFPSSFRWCKGALHLGEPVKITSIPRRRR
jgi:zinc transporter ZupT